MTTLTKLTKAELIALLKDRNEEITGMRQALGDAHHDLKRLRAQSPSPVATPRPIYVRKPYQLPAHFAAARDAAMRTGIAIKVTA